MRHGDSFHRRAQRLDVVIAIFRAVGEDLVRQPLLIVALEIGHEVGVIPAARSVESEAQVAAVAHGRLREVVRHFSPEHEAAIR